MKSLIFTLFCTFVAVFLIATPEVVVFDFGGVMTGEQNRSAIVNFICESFHFSETEFEQANLEKRAALKQGMTDAEFWLAYSKKNHIQLPSRWEQSFKEVMKSSIGINTKMYNLVEELKAVNIRVALLSNIDERLSKIVREFGLYQPFNPCLLSCEIGIEKPDPRAFEFLLRELNVESTAVIFIDDKHENVDAAKLLGLDAILFESEQQLRDDLVKRGLLASLKAVQNAK